MIFFKGIKVEEKLFFEFASIKKNEKVLFLGFDQATKAEYNEYRNITIQSSYADEISNDDLPGVIDGLVYGPGSIVLKPLKSLSDEQFLSDFTINQIQSNEDMLW